MNRKQAIRKAKETGGEPVRVNGKWAVKIVIGSAGGHIFYSYLW